MTEELIQAEKSTYQMSRSFMEELEAMTYQERCIVLGIVMGTPEKEIFRTLRLSHEELRTLIHEKGLARWKFFRALLDS